MPVNRASWCRRQCSRNATSVPIGTQFVHAGETFRFSFIDPRALLLRCKLRDTLSCAIDGIEFLAKPSDNTFGIEFVAFKLRDMDRKQTLFEVKKPEGVELEEGEDDYVDDTGRFVPYNFPPQFLQLKKVGATVTFTVGEGANDFRMVERHFFKNKLLKSFDFDFGFCIPGSTNTCEHIYDFPKLSSKERDEMIANPGETKSDSFYFVNGKLIMHNKAEYSYNVGEGDGADS
eukprot:m.834065 g.834065  ORF g.834065 m.834065 type:complete len:232 (+) comp23443_c0_seq4:158-853(+)